METMNKTATHQTTTCVRATGPVSVMYVGKGWKALFRCPTCGRECWQHLNYLGRRNVQCDGVKFSKK